MWSELAEASPMKLDYPTSLRDLERMLESDNLISSESRNRQSGANFAFVRTTIIIYALIDARLRA